MSGNDKDYGRPVVYSERCRAVGENFNKMLEKGVGVFKAFGLDYEEFETGPGTYSTAMIETTDGNVLNLPLGNFRFTDKEKAINAARSLAKKKCKHRKEYRENNYPKCLFHADFSHEGYFLYVEEIKVEE